MSNKVYDIAKYVAIVGLPAFITLVGVVGVQLGYEMTTPVVILTAINTFLGTLLGISSVNYNNKVANEDEGK